jgi:hypothetical protein
MMNERIRALADEATTTEYGVDNGFDRVTFDREKFAELIVQDVLNEVLQAMDDGQDVYYTVADKFRS